MTHQGGREGRPSQESATRAQGHLTWTMLPPPVGSSGFLRFPGHSGHSAHIPTSVSKMFDLSKWQLFFATDTLVRVGVLYGKDG